jgi:hypothetical protein
VRYKKIGRVSPQHLPLTGEEELLQVRRIQDPSLGCGRRPRGVEGSLWVIHDSRLLLISFLFHGHGTPLTHTTSYTVAIFPLLSPAVYGVRVVLAAPLFNILAASLYK